MAGDAVRRTGAWRTGAWRDGTWRDGAWRDGAWREPAWLARVRAARLAGPLLPRWHLARATEQLPVIVFLGVYRSA